MKIFFVYFLFITKLNFQDSSLFYDQTIKGNLKYYSNAYDIVIVKEGSEDDSDKNFRIVSFDEQQDQVFFDSNDQKLSIQKFLWETKLSNLFIFPVLDLKNQNYKVKIDQGQYDNLKQAIEDKKEIENLEGEIELEKAQVLDTVFHSVFFPQKTLQDDVTLEIQIMSGALMKRVFNILIFLSGNFDSVVQYEYNINKNVKLNDDVHNLSLQFINESGNPFDIDPLNCLDYLYKPQNNNHGDFDKYKIRNQFSGFQNFKTDPWVVLNLDASQLTLGNGNMIQLEDEYTIELDGQFFRDFKVVFEIDFENGFKFFSNPLDFMASFLEKVEAYYQDIIIELKEEDQEEGALNNLQSSFQSEFRSIFVEGDVKELYFEIYTKYFSDFIARFYEHVVLKYTSEVVPLQYYRNQYYEKLKQEEQFFEKKTNPINNSYFKFNILSQILEFCIELQGFTLTEYFDCLNLNLDEKNGTRNKCQFFQKELIDFYGQNQQNIVTIKNLKNLAFGNYDQSFEYYENMIKQYMQGYFNLNFKKYITKTHQSIIDNIENMITQKLSFAKDRILI